MKMMMKTTNDLPKSKKRSFEERRATTTTTTTSKTANSGKPHTGFEASGGGKKRTSVDDADAKSSSASNKPIAMRGTLCIPKNSGDEKPWYDVLKEMEATELGSHRPQHRRRTLEAGKERAEECLKREVEKYKANKSERMKAGDADERLAARVLSSGTLTDKVSAMALEIATAPVQNLAMIDALLGFVKKMSHREILLASEALRDAFLGALLPPDRHLRRFQDSPCPPDSSDEVLTLRAFEHHLKTRFLGFCTALEYLARHATLKHTKRLAMRTCYEMLVEKPEQEKYLLEVLVKKMGDPDAQIAQHASHLLSQLTKRHPNMRLAVVKEVEVAVLSPYAKPEAMYVGTLYLSQTILSRLDAELAQRLIDIYFAVFESRAETAVEGKLLSAVLSGVNRALPYATEGAREGNQISGRMEKFALKFRSLVSVAERTTSFGNATQALMLLHKLAHDQEQKDAFYRVLYERIRDPALPESKKKTMFLNLLYKAMRADSDARRAAHFAKRLLQAGLLSKNSALAAGAVFLVGTVMKERNLYERWLGRVGQVGEEEEVSPVGDDEEEAAARNARRNRDEQEGEEEGKRTKRKMAINVMVGATSSEATTDGAEEDDDECVLWELASVLAYFHPSVRVFGERAAVKREGIDYTGDPLRDFSLSAFLDRFSFRNPKQRERLGEEASGSSTFGLRGRAARVGQRALTARPANTLNFALSNRVPVDLRFFKSYVDKVRRTKHGMLAGEFASADAGGLDDLERREDEFATRLAIEMMERNTPKDFEIDFDEDEDLRYEGGDDEMVVEEEEDVIDEEQWRDEDQEDDTEEEEEEDGPQSTFADAEEFSEMIARDEDEDDGAVKERNWKRQAMGTSRRGGEKRRRKKM